jgi:tetratricopeptide (TPR) repeat protein
METPGFRRRVFVVMPFGKKEVPKKPRVEPTTSGELKDDPLRVDFDAVYEKLFSPALQAAGLQPFRADDEQAAGDILKDMFAELVTADFVLADISILNANVFYELGIRHTVGPRGVICLHAGWSDRPFDVAPMRTFSYDGKLFRVGRERDDDWEKTVNAEVVKLTQTISGAVAVDRTTEGSPVYSNLPNLRPVDASGISTARFKYYQGQASEWNQRVAIAGKEGRAEDILTLAGDVPSPYYRRKLLRQCGEALLALGRFNQAEKVFRELCEDLDGSGSTDEFRVKCQLALIANRLGRANEAELKLADLAKQSPGDPEAQGLLGRVYKDMWRMKWSGKDKTLEERTAAARQNATVARKSLNTYALAFRRNLGSYYTGINVVALATLLDHAARQIEPGARVELADLEDLKTIVRVAATNALAAEGEEVWARATLGELHLVLGNAAEACDHYEQAAADTNLTWFHVRSMLEQVQLYQLLGYRPEVVEAVAGLLQKRCDELAHPIARFGKVVICSGHMIDTPTRNTPRFPPQKEAVVRAAISNRLDKWNIGQGDLAVCGGACGADLLFAEECQKRDAHVRLLLANDTDAFVESSVRLPDTDWVERFYAMSSRAEVATQPERLGKEPPSIDVYARTNLWIINTARVEADSSAKIHALLVWDEQSTGDGPGGTSDFAARVRQLGGYIAIINPTKLQP